jgi:hypothetical protein
VGEQLAARGGSLQVIVILPECVFARRLFACFDSLSTTPILEIAFVDGNCFYLHIPGANFGHGQRLHNTVIALVVRWV